MKRLPWLPAAGRVARGLRPPLQQRSAHGITGRGEVEGAGELAFGLFDVERKRPLARQGKVAHDLRLQLLWSARRGRLVQLERGLVVVGEHVCPVFYPLTCFLLDPAGRGQVAGCAGGAWDP